MYSELDDTIVVDEDAGKIFNINKFIPLDLSDLEVEKMEDEDFDDLLSDGQTRYGLDYFGSAETAEIERLSVILGGYQRPRIKHLSTLFRMQEL